MDWFYKQVIYMPLICTATHGYMLLQANCSRSLLIFGVPSIWALLECSQPGLSATKVLLPSQQVQPLCLMNSCNGTLQMSMSMMSISRIQCCLEPQHCILTLQYQFIAVAFYPSQLLHSVLVQHLFNTSLLHNWLNTSMNVLSSLPFDSVS